MRTKLARNNVKRRKKVVAVRRTVPTRAIVKREVPAHLDARTPALTAGEALEKVLITGDLAQLTPEDRIDYVKRLCQSLGLNILTRPFDYILFKDPDMGENAPARLALYANKSCTEQLRKIHGVGTIPPLRRTIDTTKQVVMVEADVRDRTGKTDTATGLVSLVKVKKDGNGWKIKELVGREYCNAIMKCETKAKRRATLSICGLGFLDESELDTMRVVGGVTPDGRIYRLPEQDDEPREPRQLSEQANHGHAPGSEKARMAEESLKRVEEADRQFKRAKESGITNKTLRDAEERMEKEMDVTPSQKPIEQKQPARDPNLPSLEAEAITPDRFRIMGAIPETYAMIEYHCKCEDGFWFCDLAALQAMQKLQETFHFNLSVLPSTSPAKKDKPAPKTTQASSVKESGASAGPELVKGVIDRVFSTTTANKAPMRQVTILMPDKKKPTYGVFNKDLFPYLDQGKGAIEAYVTVKGKYANLVGIKSIVTSSGLKEFLEDGTPVIQRKDQEAGTTKTLFGQ